MMKHDEKCLLKVKGNDKHFTSMNSGVSKEQDL